MERTIAVEALREAIAQRRVDMEQLSRAALACRMDRLMQPFVAMLV
jgi:hypothetical protein